MMIQDRTAGTGLSPRALRAWEQGYQDHMHVYLDNSSNNQANLTTKTHFWVSFLHVWQYKIQMPYWSSNGKSYWL